MSEGKTDGHCDKGNRNRMPYKSLIGTIGITLQRLWNSWWKNGGSKLVQVGQYPQIEVRLVCFYYRELYLSFRNPSSYSQSVWSHIVPSASLHPQPLSPPYHVGWLHLLFWNKAISLVAFTVPVSSEASNAISLSPLQNFGNTEFHWTNLGQCLLFQSRWQ